MNLGDYNSAHSTFGVWCQSLIATVDAEDVLLPPFPASLAAGRGRGARALPGGSRAPRLGSGACEPGSRAEGLSPWGANGSTAEAVRPCCWHRSGAVAVIKAISGSLCSWAQNVTSVSGLQFSNRDFQFAQHGFGHCSLLLSLKAGFLALPMIL